MGLCDTGDLEKNVELLQHNIRIYDQIRNEFNDPTKELFKTITFTIIELINKIKTALCDLNSDLNNFTEGSVIFADTDGSLTEDNLNLFWKDLENYLRVGGDILPRTDNNSKLGSQNQRFEDLFAVQTTIGAFFETGLRTQGIGDLPTGTTVSWKDGKCVESYKSEDCMVMGVVKHGKHEPIIMGAEHILVTGKVNEGDYLVTSKVPGHCKGVKRGILFKKDLFGKVIAQALETNNSKSKLIKAMIRKM